MQTIINEKVLELAVGDITDAEVEAIVNAANSQLSGGGGVDGAIHRRGGPAIMQETQSRHPQGCPTGSAVLTGGGDLRARCVIHAVGPVWKGGGRGEADLLAAAYHQCFALAHQHDCRSIALPALSTGAYRYPIDAASQIALEAAIEALTADGPPELVRFVLFTEEAYRAFAAALERLAPG